MENGERDFYFNRGADGQLTETEIEQIDLSEFSIIHFGSATAFLDGPLQKAYLSLLHKAIEQKIFISFDPNYRHLLFQKNVSYFIKQSWHFLNHCNFFKVSDEEAMLITNTNSVNAAAEEFSERMENVFAITLGKEGTLLCVKKKRFIVPSIEVKPTDTTGAGDAFVGAVLYQLSLLSSENIASLTEDDWQKIIINANKAGARTCEFMGAMEAFKHLSNSIFN